MTNQQPPFDPRSSSDPQQHGDETITALPDALLKQALGSPTLARQFQQALRQLASSTEDEDLAAKYQAIAEGKLSARSLLHDSRIEEAGSASIHQMRAGLDALSEEDRAELEERARRQAQELLAEMPESVKGHFGPASAGQPDANGHVAPPVRPEDLEAWRERTTEFFSDLRWH